MVSQICRYRLGEIEHTTLLIGVFGMRNVYHFVDRLSTCLEKHGQFQKLGNIYNMEMVARDRIELSTRGFSVLCSTN